MAIITVATLNFEGFVGGGFNTCLFRVDYTIEFRNNELGTEFDEAARIREHDPDDDELITAYPLPLRFTATQNRMNRSFKIVVIRDQLNTELGNEELQGDVWLRRVGNHLATSEVTTPILKFAA
jgi:hypothetical protein